MKNKKERKNDELKDRIKGMAEIIENNVEKFYYFVLGLKFGFDSIPEQAVIKKIKNDLYLMRISAEEIKSLLRKLE